QHRCPALELERGLRWQTQRDAAQAVGEEVAATAEREEGQDLEHAPLDGDAGEAGFFPLGAQQRVQLPGHLRRGRQAV
ncbi:unnamed protein product, partial [Effrenium voratum]